MTEMVVKGGFLVVCGPFALKEIQLAHSWEARGYIILGKFRRTRISDEKNSLYVE